MVGDGDEMPFLISVWLPGESRFRLIEPFLMSRDVIVPFLICEPVMSDAAVADVALTTSAVLTTRTTERVVPLLATARVRAATPRILGESIERNLPLLEVASRRS